MNKPGERSFHRVLVANRGEIAVRIMRTLAERGIESVAIYSDVDRAALHVLMADRAHSLGGSSPRESYLNIDKVIEACRQHQVDAVHPGYGFLSENGDFADRLAAAGIVLIGPPSHAMRLMGSKTEARAAMIAAGVPVVPGHNGPDGNGFADVDAVREAVDSVGFPVLIKAAAGGGGKGMRLVTTPKELVDAFAAAKREALSAFGDDRVYVERAIVEPRHVEIQVFGDSQGNVVHLGERDCSMQRRHQKVVEESPCPVLAESVRSAMGAAATAAAKSCGYVGAGTVEFLLTTKGEFFFLEMNTRLQVEHPVTELVYGVDLVAWQLDAALGLPLPLTQAQLDARRHGAAIECRVYAEDSVNFLPSPGRITQLRVPGGPFVRDDSGVYAGAEISSHYDPMISKLIVWGQDRATALARMRRALREYQVAGIDSNLVFLRRLLAAEPFASGQYHTGTIAASGDLREGNDIRDAGAQEAAMMVAVARRARETVRPVDSSGAGNGGARSRWKEPMAPRRWR